MKETTDAATAPAKSGSWKHLTVVVTVLGIVAMYCLALRTGAAFVFFGYVWADTCWLLKLGQIIADNASLPKSDLFSFTLPLFGSQTHAPPYTIYQWLAELLFFLGYSCFNPIGLLIAGSFVMTFAFLTIPLRACMRANAPVAWSIVATATASLSANVRCVIRPEIFTYLNLGITLVLLQSLRMGKPGDGTQSASINWRTVGLFALLTGIWCNLHSGFVSGLILLAIYGVFFSLEDLLGKKPLSGASKTTWAAFAVSSLATLLNPYGAGLWRYLPHLFFMPINSQIDECKPFLGLPLYRAIYFLGTVLICWGAILLALFKTWKEIPSAFRSPVRQSSLFIVLLATFLGFWMRRLTPIAAIIMVIETANYLGGNLQIPRWFESFWKRKMSYLAFELVMLLFAGVGVLAVVGKATTVTIPSSTQDFRPPFAAVRYFMKEHQDGRVFASLPIADMLDMYWGPHSAVFIDSRMDAYSDQIIEDYLKILYGTGNWHELLQRYEIDWIFLSPDKPVCKLLEGEAGWELVYRDPRARIFRRR